MFTLAFWKDAFARAVEMSAHAVVAVSGANIAFLHLPWHQMVNIAGAAFVTSILTSLIAVPAPGSASAVGPLLRVYRTRHGKHEDRGHPATGC